MTREEYRFAFQNVVFLCSKAVKGEIPDPNRVKTMDLTHLYRAAKFHMLTAACAIALEKAGVEDENFRAEKGRAIRKVALLELEKEKLFARLEEEKIWHMPLKGAVLQELYPTIGMREMVDVDVLFDASCREKVKAIMEEMGFYAEQYGLGNHDCYRKEPLYNFEMHTALIDASYQPAAARYYESVTDKLLSDGDNTFAKHFSDEDFYIFMLAHGYKHYHLSGIGLRFLLDLFVFLELKKEKLDRSYIEAELEKLDMLDFEKQTRELAEKLYQEIPLSAEETERLEYYYFSGSQGTRENILRRKIQQEGEGKIGKFRYIFHRVFLPMEQIKRVYPTVYQHKILVPFLPFYRMARGLVFHRKAIKEEIKQLKK